MGVDRRMWKMTPERLQEHLILKSRARRIPDKKKENNRRACRDARRALPHSHSSEERKSLVRSCCGLSRTSRGVPDSTTRPSAMKIT